MSITSPSANILISKAVSYAVSHGYQIDPDVLELLQEMVRSGEKRSAPVLPESIIANVIEEKARVSIGGRIANTSVSVHDLATLHPDLLEKMEALKAKRSGLSSDSPLGPTRKIGPLENIETKIEIVNDSAMKIRSVGKDGFLQLFKSRYEKLLRILKERPEARQLTKISELKEGKGGRTAGLVYSKRSAKNGIELTIDDDSGRLSIFVMNEDSKKAVNEIALDQCVMVEVDGKNGRYILKSITQPDLPNRIFSPSKKTVYAVFLSDLHIGSNKFLEGAFSRFLEWISGRGPRAVEDQDVIERLKYVIIGGDIVDGVGVYPSQEYELNESNIYKQYEIVSRKLSSIPNHLSVLAIPGNHDSTRQALPQPVIPRKYAESIYQLKNVTMLGDPALVKLNGVSILVFHGRSLDDILATTPGQSYEKPTEAMKILLKARHLAPIFGSRTPIAPETEDHLVIEQIPDIFHAGHVHSVGVENYRSTIIINSGTWQAQTGYQANLGIMPRPGLVPIVNLATLETITREFLTTYEPITDTSN